MTSLIEAFPDVDRWVIGLYDHIEKGNVSERLHPDLPLRIYNYTPKCAYDRAWDEVTLNCRGLILDFDNNIVARPFRKFFNLGEPGVNIPDGPPHLVQEKMDGSLGIAYQYDGHIGVATRGSFVSDQALWASEWLLRTFPEWMPHEGVTTLFEIIYPDNRIVVNYGDRAELVRLTSIDNKTGADCPMRGNSWPGAVAPTYATTTIEELLRRVNERNNTEGFVCVWHNGDQPATRIKMKSEDYIALHRIVTGLSNRIVWEHLSAGTVEELRDSIPDEFYEWFDEQTFNLKARFDIIHSVVQRDLDVALERLGNPTDRKSLAHFIKDGAKYPGLCFALHDKKPTFDQMIWRMIRPERETPILAVQEDEE